MQYRHIEYPKQTLTITQDETAVVLDFAWFVRYFVNTSPRFNQSGAGIRQGGRIEAAIEGEPGVVVWREEDWCAFADAIDNPENGYPIQPARALLPFLEAVANAKPAPETAAAASPA